MGNVFSQVFVLLVWVWATYKVWKCMDYEHLKKVARLSTLLVTFMIAYDLIMLLLK